MAQPRCRRLVMLVRVLMLGAVLTLGVGHARADDADQPGEPVRATPDGTWTLITVNRGRTVDATMTLRTNDKGRLEGRYQRPRQEPVVLQGVAYDAPRLTFYRTLHGQRVAFEATLAGDGLVGHHTFGSTKVHVFGGRTPESVAAARSAAKAHLREASKRSDDPEEDYARHSSQVKPRDWFPVLDHPELVEAKDSKGVLENEPVIGIVYGGEARAYPVSIMGVHELVNDTCGGVPLAVSW